MHGNSLHDTSGNYYPARNTSQPLDCNEQMLKGIKVYQVNSSLFASFTELWIALSELWAYQQTLQRIPLRGFSCLWSRSVSQRAHLFPLKSQELWMSCVRKSSQYLIGALLSRLRSCVSIPTFVSVLAWTMLEVHCVCWCTLLSWIHTLHFRLILYLQTCLVTWALSWSHLYPLLCFSSWRWLLLSTFSPSWFPL